MRRETFERGDMLSRNFEVEELKKFKEIDDFYRAMVQVYNLPHSEVLEREAHFFSHSEQGFLFAIRDHGHIIAGVQLMVYSTDGLWYGYSQNKFVDRDYEGKGLAQILKQKEEWAAARCGCKVIVCFIDPSRRKALRSIELSGYVPAPIGFLPSLQAQSPTEVLYVKKLL